MDASIENVISSFRTEFLKKDKQINDFRCLIDLTDESKLFSIEKKGALQEIISHIHGCLNTSKHRAEGFLFLDKLVEQCVTEVFTQNALTWIRFIIQCLESHDPPELKNLASNIGCRILPLTVNFTALSKDVTGILPQLLSVLLPANSQWLQPSLNLINVCIQSYPGPCGAFKGKIEAMLMDLFVEVSVPKAAITSYILLAGCGGGGTKGMKYTGAWLYKCQQILSSLNNTVDLLYEGLNITDTSSKSVVPPLPTIEMPEQHTDRFNILTTYFSTYSKCLQELLSRPFSAPVKIPIDEIIQIIHKTLTVNSKILHSRPSMERLLLSGYISTIHKEAVLCLQSLISRCKSLLLSYSKSVVSLLVQELMWSRLPVVYGQNRAYNCLRQTVYKTVILWLQTTQSFTETSTEEEWLVQEILHDSRPHKDNMKMDSNKNKKSSNFEPPPAKKKKKGGYSDLSHGISSQRKIDLMSNSELSVTALEALYWLLSTVGCQLEQKTVQEIQEFIISVAITFRGRSNFGIPYTNDRCRHRLLMVMQVFNLMPHPTVSSILQHSLSVLRCTVQDDSLLVSSFSTQSLIVCETLVHARAPCFHKPKIVQKEIIQDITENGHHVSANINGNNTVMKLNGTPSFFDTITDKIIKDNKKSENYGAKTDSSFNGGSVKETAAENSYKIIDIFSNTRLNEMNEGWNNSKPNQKESIPFSKLSSHTLKTGSLNPCSESSINAKPEISEKEEGIIHSQSPEQPLKSMPEQLSVTNVENQTISMEVDNEDIERDVNSTPEAVPQITSSTRIDTECIDNTLQKEDQEDIDNILSTFVDVDTDQ